MQPQQPLPAPNPNPHQDFSIDYLNQLDPNPKRAGGPNAKLLIAVAILGVLAIVFFIFTITSSGGSSTPTARMQSLHLRLQTIRTLTANNHKKLRSNQLRSANSNLTSILGTTIKDLEETATTANVDLKKPTKEQTAKEAAYKTKLSDAFAEALLNVELDKVYARQMTYEISLLKSSLTSLRSSSSNKSVDGFVASNLPSFESLEKDFQAFSSAD